LITIGRTVILVGSRDQIAQRLAEIRKKKQALGETNKIEISSEVVSPWFSPSLERELDWSEQTDLLRPIHELVPPDLPEDLSPAQLAQLTELLQYFHIRLRRLVHSVAVERDSETVTLEQRHWQGVLDLYDRVAHYLRMIGEPPP